MKKHDRSGAHHVALAMWVSKGQKSSALGTLPPHVRDGVLTAFRAVYQGEKSGGSLQDFLGDLSMIELSGGNVLPGYRSRFSARGNLAAIAVPFRNTQGAIIQSAEFLALASDSATDRAAHKAELVYYRTMFEGKPRTVFLSCQALPNGTASGIFSSYKRAFTAAGLEVTDWIPKLVWYCADGATVMQGRQEGVYALLRDLQQEICGWSVVVPIHANCHRTDLAIKAALSAGHVFVDVVANCMQQVALFWNNSPARLPVLRRVALALETSVLKFGVLRERRWAAFAADAVRRMLRSYAPLICALVQVYGLWVLRQRVFRKGAWVLRDRGVRAGLAYGLWVLATWVFDFTGWPWTDEAALMQHGNADITLLASHLQPKLGSLPRAVSQFVRLKSKMSHAFEEGTLSARPVNASLKDVVTHFHATWATVLSWDARPFEHLFPLIQIVGIGVDSTARVERGWATVNWRKGLHRLRASPALTDDATNVQLHGPPLPHWDPVPAAEGWFTLRKWA